MTADEINGIDRVEQLMAADADEYGSPFQSFVPAPSSALPPGGVLATTATNTALGSAVNDPAAAGHQAPRQSPAAPSSGRRQTGSPSFAPQGPKENASTTPGQGASLPAHAVSPAAARGSIGAVYPPECASGVVMVTDRRGGYLPPVTPHPFYDRLDAAVLDALTRAGARGRARTGLARVLREVGAHCSPTGDDREVVFTLERLGRKGYLIRGIGVTHSGREIYRLLAEPLRPRIAA